MADCRNLTFRHTPQSRFQDESKCEVFFMKVNYYNKNFALGLAFKDRLKGTRKWLVAPTLGNLFLRKPLVYVAVRLEATMIYVIHFALVENKSHIDELPQKKRSVFCPLGESIHS